MMLTPKAVEEIARDEIRKVCDMDESLYRLSAQDGLSNQPRIIAIYWDVIEPEPDGYTLCRATGVDISQSEEMVRYRVRSMFAYEPQRNRLFEPTEIRVMDNPGEEPPER